MTTHHLPPSSPPLSALKALTVTSTLLLAGSMATTTLQSLPALLLAARQREPPSPTTKPLKSDSGRLTPQPTLDPETRLDLSPTAVLPGTLCPTPPSTRGFQLAAAQFSLMSKTAFVTQVPLELLSIAASGYLACRYRSMGVSGWRSWAVVAGLVAALFPITAVWMVPLEHKMARLAGVEEAVEPYEDALPDREEERGNAERFLTRWGVWSAVRSGVMLGAGVGAVWGVVG